MLAAIGCRREAGARFQGLEGAIDWKRSGVSANQVAGMIGNDMTLSVCERVLGRLLYAAGLVAEVPTDRVRRVTTPT